MAMPLKGVGVLLRKPLDVLPKKLFNVLLLKPLNVLLPKPLNVFLPKPHNVMLKDPFMFCTQLPLGVLVEFYHTNSTIVSAYEYCIHDSYDIRRGTIVRPYTGSTCTPPRRATLELPSRFPLEVRGGGFRVPNS